MARAHGDRPGHDAGRYLSDDRCRRPRGRSRRRARLRHLRFGQRLRRVLLRGVCLYGSGRRQRVHLRVRDARRVGCVDHRLGSDFGIRTLGRAHRVVVVRLLAAPARRFRGPLSRLGANRIDLRRPSIVGGAVFIAPERGRSRGFGDAGDHGAGRGGYPRVGERQRDAGRRSDCGDGRVHRRDRTRNSPRQLAPVRPVRFQGHSRGHRAGVLRVYRFRYRYRRRRRSQ